jgi:hypothetical protein
VISTADGQVFKPTTSGTLVPNGTTGDTFGSQINGVNNPGALNIEMDLPIYPYHTPQGGSVIRVWGVGLQMIGQAADLNGMQFQLSAGMAKGLPLANPLQYGLIAQGTIYQAFGNWEDTNQTLDLIVNPTIDLESDGGMAFNWEPGQSLSTAIATSLQQAFPSYTSTINISSSLQAPNSAPQIGVYTSLSAFAQYLNDLTQEAGRSALGEDYQGVSIAISGKTLNVFDGTVASPKPITQLAFSDLIGQPTWIGAAQITVKCVMRYDLQVGDQFKFPTGVATPYALTTADAAYPNAPARSKTIFQGAFQITEAHFYGNFRQPDGQSWNTTYVAIPLGS